MRRLLLPILLLAVAIGATVQMNRANEEADPGRAVGISTDVDLATPIFSARRAPEWLRNPKSDTMLVDAINTVLRTDETPPLSCVLVERDGERMAASNTAAAIRTDELHRLITATVIDAAGSGGAFRTEIAIAADAAGTAGAAGGGTGDLLEAALEAAGAGTGAGSRALRPDGGGGAAEG